MQGCTYKEVCRRRLLDEDCRGGNDICEAAALVHKVGTMAEEVYCRATMPEVVPNLQCRPYTEEDCAWLQGRNSPQEVALSLNLATAQRFTYVSGKQGIVALPPQHAGSFHRKHAVALHKH